MGTLLTSGGGCEIREGLLTSSRFETAASPKSFSGRLCNVSYICVLSDAESITAGLTRKDNLCMLKAVESLSLSLSHASLFLFRSFLRFSFETFFKTAGRRENDRGKDEYCTRPLDLIDTGYCIVYAVYRIY